MLSTIQVGSGWFPEIAGGLNRYYYDLLSHLPAAGVNYHGLVVGTDAVKRETDGRVRAYAMAAEPLARRWLKGRAAVKQLFEEEAGGEKRVLVTHFAPYAAALPKPPRDWTTVVHFHGPWAAESQREGAGRLATLGKRLIERQAYARAGRFIVLSGAFRDILCQSFGIDPARVDIIPGGVDLPRFAEAFALTRRQARERLGWPTDRPTVLAVRRLVSRIGLEMLIDAMAEVRRRVPDALCLIAGRGRLAEALQARIESAGLGQHVRLLGFVPDADLPTAYRAADVSILPSESLEGFGLSAAESLAAGTPVLVSPVGGLPEVVTELDPELILSGPATAEVIADRLSAVLIDSPRLPSDLACHTYAAATFAWPVLATRIAAAYASA